MSSRLYKNIKICFETKTVQISDHERQKRIEAHYAWYKPKLKKEKPELTEHELCDEAWYMAETIWSDAGILAHGYANKLLGKLNA
jgi:hypothetical protein